MPDQHQPPEDQGFRPIGNLMPPAWPTPQGEGSTQPKPPTPSAITGLPAPATTPSNSTGTPHGGHGAVALSTSRDLQAITEAPTERISREAVAGLLARLSGTRNAVIWRYEHSFGPDNQSDSKVVGISGLSDNLEALQAMSAALAPICQPARETRGGEAELVADLARTMSVTAGRQRDGMDDDVAVDTFVDELSNWPIDCVKRALGAWRRNEKWRPTLADILLDVEWRAKPRMVAKAFVDKRIQEIGDDQPF